MCGVRCIHRKKLVSLGMTLIEGMDRSSQEYLKAVEEELAASRVTAKALETELDGYKLDVAGATSSKISLDTTLNDISDRLSQLEIWKKSVPPSTGPSMTGIAAPFSAPPPVTAPSPVIAATTTVSTAPTSAPAPVSSAPGVPVTATVPAHALGSPLTMALQRITSPDVKLGREYDPCTYVLGTKSASEIKAFDRSKLDLNDLFFGWTRIANMILD